MLPFVDEYIAEDAFGNKTVVNEGCNFLIKCIQSSELNIFDVPNVTQYLEFKWKTTARNWHMRGWYVHCYYTILLSAYVKCIYIDDTEAVQF